MQASSFSTKTPIWTVQPGVSPEGIIEEPARLIVQGGVIVYPTETFYAVGGQPMLKSVIERIFAIKKRAADKPLPLIAASLDDALRAVTHWPVAAKRLASSFWPGPLSLVLRASSALPSELHQWTGTVAIRISSHPLTRALAEATGGLLISTSANVSAHPAIDHLCNLEPALQSQVDGVIDAGKLTGHMPSTIVDLTAAVPRLVRSGCVPWEDIERAV